MTNIINNNNNNDLHITDLTGVLTTENGEFKQQEVTSFLAQCADQATADYSTDANHMLQMLMHSTDETALAHFLNVFQPKLERIKFIHKVMLYLPFAIYRNICQQAGHGLDERWKTLKQSLLDKTIEQNDDYQRWQELKTKNEDEVVIQRAY